jgi:alpha-1,3-mannosyltransferase
VRILHLVRQFAPAIGGLESYVKSMALHQQAQGHICEVLTLNKIFHGSPQTLAPRESIDGVSVRRVPFIGHQKFFLPLIAPSYFKGFDVIHVHNTDVFFDYMALLKNYLKKPLFATTHGGFFHTSDLSAIKTVYFNTITRFSLSQYDTVFAISRNDYNRFAPLSRDCVLQPNAVEPLGNEISTGQDFLYLGRLAAHKNVHQVIETFAILVARHGFKNKLHIIGPEWDVKLNDLAALAQARGIGTQVVFHGGLQPAAMVKIIPECGFFLSASTYEGFGMSMVEGMSVGMIPYVQPNESFQELIGLADVGRCVRFDAPDQAASLIAESIAKTGMADRVRARDFAARFSWGSLASSCLTAYANALD